MEITLNSESVVNQRTGEVEKPSEYVANLRAMEQDIAHLDDEIGEAKSALKALRDQREEKVADLRAAIREGQVLPLLERGEDGE